MNKPILVFSLDVLLVLDKNKVQSESFLVNAVLLRTV